MIQNKINLLEIDFHFGLGFLNELEQGTGMDLIEIGTLMQTKPYAVVPKMMLHSANYAKLRKGATDFYELFHFYDLIDANGGVSGKFMTDFIQAFNLSMTKDVPTPEPTDSKKKVKK